MTNNSICIIDGDLIAFKASAANETRTVQAKHEPSGRAKIFKHRTEFKQSVDTEKFPLESFTITDIQEANDISEALHTAKKMIESICKACHTDKYEIYLSGNDNFRDRLPLPSKYKGVREGLIRPLQLTEVKNYLIKHHNAVTVNGEADDMLSIRKYEGIQTNTKIIGCSTDKDDNGASGWSYNWDTMTEPMLIEGLGKLYLDEKGKVRGYGDKWKYFQWIVGDKIDGLNPCELAGIRFGDKGGYKALVDLETDEECWKAVHDLYLKWYPEPVNYVDQTGVERNADYIDLAQVYWNGVHMLRWEGDNVDIRSKMKKLGLI